MIDIRACTRDDMAAVARLFQRTFRDPAAPPPAALEAYLRTLFCEHPWRDPDLPSRVAIGAGGRLIGFIGVLPVRMAALGKPVRAAVAGSLMVDNPEDNPLAGARLMRSFFAGPQDLSLSETANPVSQRMWERLGGSAAPSYSMEFLRILQPAGFAAALLAERYPAARALAPLARLGDGIWSRMPRNPLRVEHAAAARCAEIDDARLAELLRSFAADFALRPDWDDAALCYMLGHAAQKARYGPLIRRAVYGRGDQPVGLYLYHGRRGGLGQVLQILARPGMAEAVVDRLFAHALATGCVGLKGRSQPAVMDALLRRRCIFLHRSSTVVHSRDPDIQAAIRSGQAFITGLAGEGWTRLVSDHVR